MNDGYGIVNLVAFNRHLGGFQGESTVIPYPRHDETVYDKITAAVPPLLFFLTHFLFRLRR